MMRERIVLLLVIIVVCAILPRWWMKEEFIDTSAKCKDAVLDMLTMGGKKSRISAESELAPYMSVQAPEYLARMGVSFNSLPKELRDILPPLDLSEMLVQLHKQGVLGVDGGDVPVDNCILPASMLERFERVSPEFVELEDSNAYENTIYKHCYIGNLDLPSNIKNTNIPQGGLPSNISRVANADPSKDRQTVYGCRVDYRNLSDLRGKLLEMFMYSDMEAMKNIKRLLAEFKITYDIRETAKARKLAQEARRDSMVARRDAELQKLPPEQRLLDAQVVSTNNAQNEMQKALSNLTMAQKTQVENARKEILNLA